MASGYSSVYSGARFAEMFGGTGGSRREREDDYRERRHAYEAGRMERDLREQGREDSLNEQARSVFSTAWDSIREDATGQDPLTIARDYPIHAAKLKTYMDAGQYEKAFGEYSVLRAARDNGGDRLFTLSATDPRRTGNNADAVLQTGAQCVTRSEFDALATVVKATGETLTAYDLFHDGSAYKRFETGNALVRNFGSDLVKASSSDDEFERRIANRISESVVNGTGGEYRIQYRDLGDYVFKNGEMKALREELGDEGTERLVEDAIVNGIKDGTFKDRMDFVRDVVWQQKQADPTKDAYRLVRDNLDAFNRKVKAMSARYPVADPASTRRFVSKLMTIVAEEAPGAIDFDDERVSERIDRWTGLAARAEQFDIPLLVDSHEGGLAVRKAIGRSMTPQSLAGEPSETEELVRLGRAFDRATGVLSAGGVPAASVKNPGEAASALGFTTGDAALDGAAKLMVSDLLSGHVLPQMYRGTREDIAMRSLSTDASARGALAERWGEALSVSTGLSPETGAYVASTLADKAFGSGGTIPVDLRSEFMSAAFAQGVPDKVAKELRRYVKARNLVDDSKLEGLLAKYRASLTDPLIGHGLKGKDVIEAYVADMKNRMVAVMENGGDPRVVSEAAAGMGHPFSWNETWTLSDGTVVSDKEYRNKRAVGEDGRERSISTKGAIPNVGRSQRLVDMNSFHARLPAFGGQRAVSLPPGSWAGDENGYRNMMMYMKQVADTAMALQKKRIMANNGSSDGGVVPR